ncbi:MAG: XRE family transcriptional regulator [Idiomarina sp.]
MAKPLNEHRKKIKPEVQAAARAQAVGIIAEMTLAETRKARGLNQVEVAKKLNIAQSNISQMESRPDALLSTLGEYIAALGGELQLHAKFPDGQSVEITQFRNARAS